MEGWKIFKAYCLFHHPPPPPFKFCPPPVLSFNLFLWQNGWSCNIWCAILVNGSTHVEPWFLNARRTLMCVLCNKASSLLMSDTWCSFLLVLWFDITHTNTQTVHSWASTLIHPHKYIFTPPVMCSQHLPFDDYINNSLISKIYFHNEFLFKNYSVVKVIYLVD